MPVRRCYLQGKAGWSWGNQKCFLGPDARKKAEDQGKAIQSARFTKKK